MRITSIIAENKPHAHHEPHLHTMKVVKDSYFQFPLSPLGTPGTTTDVVLCTKHEGKKTACRL